MTAGWEPLDPVRCERYALFASHLERHQFDAVYWTLFVFNLFVLFSAGYGYILCLERAEKHPEGSPKRKRIVRNCIIFSAFCVAISLITVIMEAFTLMALQFCDGEDLMSLYWSTFTMIQIGSLIAVAGIILALLHTLRDRKHPPWALALGTPVLVFAGLFTFIHSCIAKRAKKFSTKASNKSREFSERRKSSKDQMVEDNTLPISRVNTLAVDPAEEEEDVGMDNGNSAGAEIIGLTFDGGPIIHFKQSVPSTLPRSAKIVGYCEDDKPIVVCSREGVKILYGGENSVDNDDGATTPTTTATRVGGGDAAAPKRSVTYKSNTTG